MGILAVGFGISAHGQVQRVLTIGNSAQDVARLLRDNTGKDRPAFIGNVLDTLAGRPYLTDRYVCGEGCLLLNTQAFDCLTLVETVLALTFAQPEIHQADADSVLVEAYLTQLRTIRYQRADHCVWDHRYFYFSHALGALIAQGRLHNITDAVGTPYTKRLDYVSKRPGQFGRIRNRAALQHLEDSLSAVPARFIGRNEVARYLPFAQTGHIIVFTNNTPGLDVTHCGIVEVQAGQVLLTHASSKYSCVIRRQPLCSYLAINRTLTGFRVFDPLIATTNR